MRDCGSIPHGDSTVSTFFINSSKKVPKFNIPNTFRLSQLKTPPQIYFNSKFHKLKLKLKLETAHRGSTVSG